MKNYFYFEINNRKGSNEVIKYCTGKLALARRELQEIVVLTSILTTPLEVILTSKTDHLFTSFGMNTLPIAMRNKNA
ncbi:hypothetical protein ACLKMH_22530 [Psychromonas sp. KJ10-10]|uniref:hypothetical protein n=1 Tax=Psychromonas sp. KJ10-10 TaxID=3391823 RepID=UPI0039B6AFE1